MKHLHHAAEGVFVARQRVLKAGAPRASLRLFRVGVAVREPFQGTHVVPIAGPLEVVAVSVVVAAVILVRLSVMANRMEAAVADMEPVELDQLEDGTYTGSFGDFLVRATVEVTVENGRIAEVEVVEQDAGAGYEALETLERIEAAQSPGVEAVSGATSSSHSIMVAVYRALTSR